MTDVTEVHHVAVKCSLPACARTPFVTAFQRNETGGLPWRHDPTAPWGHGDMENGVASWYDVPDDPARIQSRSHVTGHGTVVLLCRICGDRFEMSIKNMVRSITAVAAANEREVSIGGLRSIVATMNQRDRPS